jgi:hypothetical protein
VLTFNSRSVWNRDFSPIAFYTNVLTL